MDPVRAERISCELTDKRVGGWLIRRYSGAGKSAVVFEAVKDSQQAALKVFDPELVERFGKDNQLERIDRERSLIGEHHQHLVQIYDGGECTETGHLYVAMEFIDAPNLAESLNDIPREKIADILQQVASAALFLEEKQLAHRDIKPENIAIVSDFSKAVLLDLGVLRPFGNPGLTDEDERVFIGTLRYSSPEFLIRTEEDTLEGWRAITFYQLGAVLHDMIMQRPLFQEFTQPFAVLAEAVKSEHPLIYAEDVPPDLVLLAKNCLVKSPGARLELVSWEDFNTLFDAHNSARDAKERVKKRTLQIRANMGEGASAQIPNTRQIAKTITMRIDNIIRLVCAGNESFPPMEIISEVNEVIAVNVKFVASPNHALQQQLSVRFECKLVDVESVSVSIAASGCLLPTGAVHGTPPISTQVFRGPVDSSAMTSRIQDLLWQAIDLAQRQNDLSEQSDDPYWLNLAQELE